MINVTFFSIPQSVRLRPLFFGWTISFWLLAELGMGQAGRDEVLEGNSLFAEGRFEEAHEKYQQALEEDPSSEAIRYNLGDAKYKKNLYEEAIEAFSQASQSEDPELQARAASLLAGRDYDNLAQRSELGDLGKLQFHRSLPAKDVDQHLDFKLILVDLNNRTREIGKRTLFDPDRFTDLKPKSGPRFLHLFGSRRVDDL